MADAKLPALTEISTFAKDDYVYIVDTSDTTDDATGSSRKSSLERIGGYLSHGICQGRLTTESGVTVSTSDRTSQGTLYYTPYVGNRIAIYDGTRWKYYAFSEISLSLTLTTDKNYDVFIYDSSGTLTLELSSAWTNDTTRADALTTQDGIVVKSGSTTRRWLGVIRASGSNVTEDSKANRFIWNAYNKVPRQLFVQDLTSHTYATNTTRQYRATTTNKICFVTGEVVGLDVLVGGGVYTDGGATYPMISAALDSTSTETAYANIPASSSQVYYNTCLNIQATLGYHYISVNQRNGSGSGSVTWYRGEVSTAFLC